MRLPWPLGPELGSCCRVPWEELGGAKTNKARGFSGKLGFEVSPTVWRESWEVSCSVPGCLLFETFLIGSEPGNPPPGYLRTAQNPKSVPWCCLDIPPHLVPVLPQHRLNIAYPPLLFLVALGPPPPPKPSALFATVVVLPTSSC